MGVAAAADKEAADKAASEKAAAADPAAEPAANSAAAEPAADPVGIYQIVLATGKYLNRQNNNNNLNETSLYLTNNSTLGFEYLYEIVIHLKSSSSITKIKESIQEKSGLKNDVAKFEKALATDTDKITFAYDNPIDYTGNRTKFIKDIPVEILENLDEDNISTLSVNNTETIKITLCNNDFTPSGRSVGTFHEYTTPKEINLLLN